MQLVRFRITAASLSLAFALGAAASPAQAADPILFKIGISAPVVTIFPVWMGEAGGFYEKEGLKVEVINMEGARAACRFCSRAKSRACMWGWRQPFSPTSRERTCGW